jgi:ABC-type multidrug transport system fused ATPase/permease subunit
MDGMFKMSLLLVAVFAIVTPAWSQESNDNLEEKTQQTLESARETADAVAEAVDKSGQAQGFSAGILKPIYQLAEAFSFPAFHWIAFAVMVTGVASFALQLTLGKLVVLARAGFSLSEILSDALGLVVSLVGLVLTTQAAAENSSFTGSAAAVLSATGAGAIAGFIFYLWGQKQELQAVEGRRSASAASTRE